MEKYITQYKLISFLSWITCYFLYPSWILPISATGKLLVFASLILFFIVSAFIMNRWFNEVPAAAPFYIYPRDWLSKIRDNLWFPLICCIAVGLHISYISSPIMMFGDEPVHLQGGLLIYNYIDSRLHIYLQYTAWASLIALFILIKTQFIKNLFIAGFSESNIKKLLRSPLVILLFLVIVSGYFFLSRNLGYYPEFIRYPPVSRFLYFASYLLFGINHIGPRILQLIFYLLSAIYIYRIIALFSNRDAALLGASIYLFLPVTFFYAHTAELGCGTVFFIIACSYYFLRFVESGDNRDLLLASFLISIGSLFHSLIFLLFFICFVYLVLHKMTAHGRDFNLRASIKVLLISLVPVVPWMVIGRFFNWRTYNIVWSNLASIDRHAAFISLMLENLSWIVFALFLMSIVSVLISRKKYFTLYFVFLFISYYLFLVADAVNQSARLSMAFYPAVAIFLSQFIYSVASRIKFKHSFKLLSLVLITYLIIISSISTLNVNYYHEEKPKVEYFPSEEALKWVYDNVKENEKILTLRILPVQFYIDKFGIDRNRIINLSYEIEDVSTPHKLKSFCNQNRVHYIMFPVYEKAADWEVLNYLKDNSNNEFMPVAKFNLGKNYIYIYKLRDNIYQDA